jgi:SH3-like domain-containing protein
MKLKTLFTACLLCVCALPTWAEEKKAFEGFFGTLRNNKVNVRTGPGTQYPILWTYKLEGYPVRVVAVYDNWYKVRDVEGEEGWVFRNFVSRRKGAVVQADAPVALTKDREGKRLIARLESGVIARVDRCEQNQCLLQVQGLKGWVDRARLAMVGK